MGRQVFLPRTLRARQHPHPAIYAVKRALCPSKNMAKNSSLHGRPQAPVEIMESDSITRDFRPSLTPPKEVLPVKELILYLIAAVSSLIILGYSVHMFVTGLVSQETERWLIIGACAVGSVVIGFMAWDVLRRRRTHRGS